MDQTTYICLVHSAEGLLHEGEGNFVCMACCFLGHLRITRWRQDNANVNVKRFIATFI